MVYVHGQERAGTQKRRGESHGETDSQRKHSSGKPNSQNNNNTHNSLDSVEHREQVDFKRIVLAIANSSDKGIR
jgi:hypothetical protein